MTRKHNGTGKMQDVCPGCCPAPKNGRAYTAAFTRSFTIDQPHCEECESALDEDGTCASCNATSLQAKDDLYRPTTKTPCWQCNNCGHKLPYRISERVSQRDRIRARIMAERLQA